MCRNLLSVLKYRHCALLKDYQQLVHFKFMAAPYASTAYTLSSTRSPISNSNTSTTMLTAISQMKQRADSFLWLYPSFMGELLVCVALSNLKVRRTALKTLDFVCFILSTLHTRFYLQFCIRLISFN